MNKGKSWLAIEIGELGPAMKRFPMHVEYIPDKTAATIATKITAMLVEYGLQKNNVFELMTDGAPSMILLGKELAKQGFSQMKHLTCVVHKVHNIADVLKLNFERVYEFTGLLKRVLCQSGIRGAVFAYFTCGKLKSFKQIMILKEFINRSIISGATRYSIWLVASNYQFLFQIFC